MRQAAGGRDIGGRASQGRNKPVPSVVDCHTQPAFNRLSKGLAVNRIVEAAAKSALTVANDEGGTQAGFAVGTACRDTILRLLR